MYNLKSLNRIFSKGIWTEGPTYIKKNNKFIFSDIPNNIIYSYNFKKIEIFRYPSNFSNGNTYKQGFLYTCEHGARRVTRTNSTGKIELITDNYNGKRLNSPNDICIHSNGDIFFTDPPYGIINKKRKEGYIGKMEYKSCYVFRYSKKKLYPIIRDLDRPNGIALSKNEDRLYVSNTGKKKLLISYQLTKNFTVKKKKIFYQGDKKNYFDGFRIDKYDNVWSSYGKSVICLNPSGHIIFKIKIPETVSNLEFGGKNNKYLLITASKSVYLAELSF